MKIKLFFLVTLVYNISFSQNFRDKLDQMIEYYDNDDNKYSTIANELLNNKYGKIDNETRFYCEYFLGYELILKDEFKLALDKYKSLLKFCELNTIDDTYGNLRKCIKDIKSRVKSLDAIVANLPVENNPAPEINNTLTENSQNNVISETIKDEDKNKDNNENKISNNLNSNFSNKDTSNNNNNTVTLTVSGTGKTIEEAKTNALRSAIEQAFGAFISSKTEILNDKLISDQITSITNGNIQSFEILNTSQLPNGIWETFLKANISIDKLTSFVETKGITIEIKGGLFALNIKQQLLNEQGEINTVYRMFEILHSTMQISFDYNIEAGQPKSIDSESKNWIIPLMISASANENMAFCSSYFTKTLKAISLSNEEVETYKSLNKKVYSLFIGDDKVFFRKENTIKLIKSFLSNWKFYLNNFVINSGLDEKYGVGKTLKTDFHHLFGTNLYSSETSRYDPHYLIEIVEDGYYSEFITFPYVNQIVAKFSYNDSKTLEEIEKITKYIVKSRGTVSEFKFGGYVLYEKNGHGLIVYPCDLKNGLTLIEAKSACSELNQNGFDDWRLPTKEELHLVYKNLFLKGFGNFFVQMHEDYSSTMYWTNDERNSYASYLWFKDGQFSVMDKYSKNQTRAVRSF